jgi:hypothetical protein
MRQRTKLRIKVGDALEVAAAGFAIWAVLRLAGFSWALVATAILLVVGAELVFGEVDHPEAPPGTPRTIRIPLPLKPEPRRWLKERRQAWGLRWAVLGEGVQRRMIALKLRAHVSRGTDAEGGADGEAHRPA